MLVMMRWHFLWTNCQEMRFLFFAVLPGRSSLFFWGGGGSFRGGYQRFFHFLLHCTIASIRMQKGHEEGGRSL